MKKLALIPLLSLLACGGEPPNESTATPSTSVAKEDFTITTPCACLPGKVCLSNSIQTKFWSDGLVPTLTNRYVVAGQGVVRTDVDYSVTGTFKATCSSLDGSVAKQIFAFHMVSGAGHINCDLKMLRGTGNVFYASYGDTSDVCTDSTYNPPIQTFRPFDGSHYIDHFILYNPSVVGVSGPAFEIGSLFMFQINTFGDRYVDQAGLVEVSNI